MKIVKQYKSEVALDGVSANANSDDFKILSPDRGVNFNLEGSVDLTITIKGKTGSKEATLYTQAHTATTEESYTITAIHDSYTIDVENYTSGTVTASFAG